MTIAREIQEGDIIVHPATDEIGTVIYQSINHAGNVDLVIEIEIDTEPASEVVLARRTCHLEVSQMFKFQVGAVS